MTSTLRSWLTAALTASFVVAGGLAPAQDPPSPPGDDGLESLLKKLEEPKPDAPSAKEDKDKAKDPAGDRDKDKPADKPKAGVVAPKDQSLDSLLEKLGETVDRPRADDKPPTGKGPMPPDEPPPPGGDGQKGEDQKKSEALKGDAQDLDEHLKALTGKRDPKDKKKQDGGKGEGKPGEGAENGPLDQVIKEMRDVEERLGQPDTGEDTRKKQAEIVKNLDTLIEQMNQSRSQSQAMRMLRQGQKPGQPQPGQGQQQGAMANGPPPTRPSMPNGKAPVALDKDAWGHLPEQLREEMGNVFKEGPLPSAVDLIRQYYLSLNKKSASREE